ncbi:MAG: SCO family protein [Flavobacteriaceae bacterium]|nr:SCO family protein [Flavobacteriaceae bacterium]
MRAFFAKYKTFALVMILLSAVIVILFYNALKPEETLPVYQPADFDAQLVDSTIQLVRKYHTIADFSLTNQNGETITQEDYKGKIYIADFFFTTCPSICPIMTKNMAGLQQELQDKPEVMLLSHSVTPEIDSVSRLKEYALENGVNDQKWNLLTGPKKEIYELARKSYLVVQEDGNGGPFDMIHTENFVLVDKERRIRGTYDGTDSEDMKRLLADVEILRESYDD